MALSRADGRVRIGPGVRPFRAGEPCAVGREWAGPGTPACANPAVGDVRFRDRPGEVWPVCGEHGWGLYEEALAQEDGPAPLWWWRHTRAAVLRWIRLRRAPRC